MYSFIKKNAGKILQMGLLKYAFDNKIAVKNECNQHREENFIRTQNVATHQNIRTINCQTSFYIFNFL